MQLHLSTQLCTTCEQPMVVEWVGYLIGPHTPRHASCVQFAKVWAEHRDWFVEPPAPEPLPLNEDGKVPLSYVFRNLEDS